MRKGGLIVLFLTVIVAAFVVGVCVGRSAKRESGSSQPLTGVTEQGRILGSASVLVASIESCRKAISEREGRIEDLKVKLQDARGKLPPPLGPEDEKRKKEENERRKRSEGRRARYGRVENLRVRILQRKDKALRAQSLEELAALLQSQEAEDLEVGLATFRRLWGIDLDKGKYKPYVLAALTDDDPEVRLGALACASDVCEKEEQFEIVLSMAGDSSAEVRGYAVSQLRWSRPQERNERVAAALRALLQDEDESVRGQALYAVSGPHDYGQEMEDVLLEMSKDPAMAGRVQEWLMDGRRALSAKLAQRLVEMLGEGDGRFPLEFAIYRFADRDFSDEAKPIISRLCLGFVRDGLEPWFRQRALEAIRRMGDASLLPELEAMAKSDDAEGIEKELAETIEYLRQKGNGRR